jgi:hypothetical protein
MFSRLLQLAAFLALVLAPAVPYLVDRALVQSHLPAGIPVKDALNVLLIAVLAGVVLADRFVRHLRGWLRVGPWYRRVDHQYFYDRDGTVVTRSAFAFVNGWGGARTDLPAENLVWHRPITRQDLVYRLYQRGRFGERALGSAHTGIVPAGLHGEPRPGGDWFFAWTPRVTPPLRRKERIAFMAEIRAERTEVAAFTPAGTKLGFGVHQPTGRVRLRAYAPFGHRFRLLEPRLSLRDARTLEELPAAPGALPPVRLSPDGSVLELKVRRPGRRYWVHYRFEPLTEPA